MCSGQSSKRGSFGKLYLAYDARRPGSLLDGLSTSRVGLPSAVSGAGNTVRRAMGTPRPPTYGTARTDPSSAATKSSSRGTTASLSSDKKKPKKKPKKKIAYRRLILPSEEVSCPWCGAAPGESCTGQMGNISTIHKARRMNEQALSGNSPGAKERLEKYLDQLRRRKQ